MSTHYRYLHILFYCSRSHNSQVIKSTYMLINKKLWFTIHNKLLLRGKKRSNPEIYKKMDREGEFIMLRKINHTAKQLREEHCMFPFTYGI